MSEKEDMIDNTSYSIGRFDITKADNILDISLNKAERKRAVFFLIFSPVIYIAFCIWMFTLLPHYIPFLAGALAIVILITATFNFFSSLYKTYKKFKGSTLVKKDGYILINGRTICLLSDIKCVIVQPKSNFYQVIILRSSIGIQINEKNLPISYDHISKNALLVADIFSRFFNCPISERKIDYMPLFTKW